MSGGARGAAWKPPRKVGVALSERDAPVVALAVSSDGHYGALVRRDGWVEQIDLESGAVVVEGWHRGAVALALSPSALVTVDAEEAGWWTRRGDAPDGRVRHGLCGVAGAASVDLGAHVLVWSGTAWASWRALTRRPVGGGSLMGTTAAALGHAWVCDGATVARVTGSGRAEAVWTATRGAIAARAWLQDDTGAWTVDGRTVDGPPLDASVTPGVDVLWSLVGGVLTRWSSAGPLPLGDGITAVAAHPSDRYALAVDACGAVRLLDAGVLA
ncbi:MAG: hypothetical protein RLZZ383_2713 [Pseudomonadota bacterium]